MVETLPVNFNNDVLGFYHKQKSEFHFQQKTDNEFLMFLLDTAVRVISIVQHLAPVIEAVSEASNEAEDALDEEEYNLQQQISQQHLEQFNHQQQSQQHEGAVMEVDSLSQEVIKEQIAVVPPAPPLPDPSTTQNHAAAQQQANLTHQAEKRIAEQLLESFNSQLNQSQLNQSQVNQSQLNQSQLNQSTPISIPIQSTAPSVPTTTTEESIPVSIPASIPATTQPSEPDNEQDIKSEDNIPEIIEIKEEPSSRPSAQPLLPDDQLQQLMSSISSNEDNFRIQNFVPTAQPSNLPQSFLDRNTNPLSMLSLSNSGKAPPLLSAPFDSNLFSNISTDKLPGTSGSLDNKAGDSKGNSTLNPNNTKIRQQKKRHVPGGFFSCESCFKQFQTRQKLNVHRDCVHLKLKPFKCEGCGRAFGTMGSKTRHLKDNCLALKDGGNMKQYRCEFCGKEFGTQDGRSNHLKRNCSALKNLQDSLPALQDLQD